MSRRFEYIDCVRANIGASARLGVSAKRNDGFRIYLHCSECNQEREALHTMRKLPPDQIAKRMKNAGWDIGPRRAICPNHEKERTSEVRPHGDTSLPPKGHPAEGIVMIDAPAVPTDKARAARRETVMLLEDVFDTEKGCFKGGESDESVAKAVDLSTDAVAKIREEFFGPLKTPPELASFVAELQAISKTAEETQANYIGEMHGIQSSISNLTRRIENFAKARGWSL